MVFKADYIYGKGEKEDFKVIKKAYVDDVEAQFDAEDTSWEKYVKENVLKERVDYLHIGQELVKAYGLKSKVRFTSGTTLAEYVPETDTIYLRRSYPKYERICNNYTTRNQTRS